ncbi:pyridoxamine 5'-phosphate oxidase family protein [Frankia sp. Cppng1_Ct_nod]|uniref:pyridoxamine 5'-phosphate oxidase family protein n=1 Tax=Frankia sp. Cppng1_Ct_nod TaxID=2897162 RepID=UPI001F5EAC90|nr:pyridoxamine 5'-phosphate oxidase family protein [Frankia sp. Cppng1_Ct_nod]
MSISPTVDHAGLSVLTFEECLTLLRTTPVGRIAFASDGEVEILPVNYTVDGTIVAFRTADGSKLMAALSNAAVAFEIDGYHAGSRQGWSVVVKGTCDLVSDPWLARLEATSLEPWADTIARERWVGIRAHSITGRRITAP